jgi:hypothetical protein
MEYRYGTYILFYIIKSNLFVVVVAVVVVAVVVVAVVVVSVPPHFEIPWKKKKKKFEKKSILKQVMVC